MTKESEESWWSAKFTNGPVEVNYITVHNMDGGWEQIEGAEVYVGDQLCDTVTFDKTMPQSDEGPQYAELYCGKCIDWHKSIGSGRYCAEYEAGSGVTGDSVTVKRKNGALTFCDIVLYKGSRFPIVPPEVIG